MTSASYTQKCSQKQIDLSILTFSLSDWFTIFSVFLKFTKWPLYLVEELVIKNGALFTGIIISVSHFLPHSYSWNQSNYYLPVLRLHFAIVINKLFFFSLNSLVPHYIMHFLHCDKTLCAATKKKETSVTLLFPIFSTVGVTPNLLLLALQP